MILVLSSTCEVTSLNYDGTLTLTLNSSNLNVQVMLNSLFESEGIDCSVLTALASTLLFGSFSV